MGRIKDQLYPGNNKLMSGMLACVPLHCCGQGVLSSLPVHSLFKKCCVVFILQGRAGSCLLGEFSLKLDPW